MENIDQTLPEKEEVMPVPASNNTQEKVEDLNQVSAESPMSGFRNILSTYSWLALPAVFVAGIIGLGLLFYFTDKAPRKISDAELTPTPISSPVAMETSTPEPIITPTPTTVPTPTPKPSVAPSKKPSPTPSPTPTTVVDNSFTCGASAGSYPALPAIGPTPLFVTLYPAGGTNGGISLAGFEWDFDGDGVWEGGVANGKVGRTYDKSGTYTPKYRVKGANGAVGPTCTYQYQVAIGGGASFQNDIIMVDKSFMEVTISKSKNNYTFTGSQSQYNDKPGYIYVPYVNISTKKKANAIIITAKAGASTDHGTITGSSYMDEGTLWPTQLWVSKTLSNGTYEGEMKIQTTDSSGVTRYDATTVTYKINLVD